MARTMRPRNGAALPALRGDRHRSPTRNGCADAAAYTPAPAAGALRPRAASRDESADRSHRRSGPAGLHVNSPVGAVLRRRLAVVGDEVLRAEILFELCVG